MRGCPKQRGNEIHVEFAGRVDAFETSLVASDAANAFEQRFFVMSACTAHERAVDIEQYEGGPSQVVEPWQKRVEQL